MPRTTRPRVLTSNGSPRVIRAPSPRRLQSLATDPAASLPPLDPFVAKAESPRLRAAPSRPGLPPGRVGSERSLPRGRHLKNRAAVGRVPGHRTLRAALAALGGDELDTFPGMNVESENVLRLEPLSSRRTFTTPHGEAANVLR